MRVYMIIIKESYMCVTLSTLLRVPVCRSLFSNFSYSFFGKRQEQLFNWRGRNGTHHLEDTFEQEDENEN